MAAREESSPEGLQIRDANPDDAHAIAAINVSGWKAAYRGIVSDEGLDAMSVDDLSERFIESMNESMNNPDRDARVLVAVDGNGQVVGYTGVGPPREPEVYPLDAGEVYAIYVDPERWGTGAGRSLFAAAEDALRDAGYVRGFLWVLEQNPRARRFYEIAGWRWDGTRSNHQVRCENLTVVRYVVDL